MTILVALSLLLWLAVLLAPWQPWRCRERLEADNDAAVDGAAFTVVIPARNEAEVVGDTLTALAKATPNAPIVVIDDQSDDDTAAIIRAQGNPRLTLINGTPPAAGWSGKLWALEQGLRQVSTPYVLLLDADIRLAPGLPAALLRKAKGGHALVCVLAEPNWHGFWAGWLLPAYVYFFKMIYPFALANCPHSRVAAGAGGVALAECTALRACGGFPAWRGAIIDDCSMARHFKRAGYRSFIGLSHGATSLRRQGFTAIAHMVARTAFVQLHESLLWVAGVSALMLLAYALPVVALFAAGMPRELGIAAWALLATTYLPTLCYYCRNPFTALLLPAVAALYLGMTWLSALRGLSGTCSAWKGRRYPSARKE